eukprot:6195316-Pleurochrysis_carterae.AAC.1
MPHTGMRNAVEPGSPGTLGTLGASSEPSSHPSRRSLEGEWPSRSLPSSPAQGAAAKQRHVAGVL